MSEPSPAIDHFDEMEGQPHDALATSGLISNGANSVFLLRVEGDSMAGEDIRKSDVVVLNRTMEPDEKTVVVAALNGQFVVARIKVQNDQIHLVSGEQEPVTLPVDDDADFTVWGVVTHVIRNLLAADSSSTFN